VVAAGIIGGLIAVPLLAVANTAIRYLKEHPDEQPLRTPDTPDTEPTDEDKAAAEELLEPTVERRDPEARAGATELPTPGKPAPTGDSRTVNSHP
jgi:putative heme transporter